MALTYDIHMGVNDILGTPQAILTGGPFDKSVIELKDKNCSSVTIREDDTHALYINTNNTNQKNQHIFLYEKGT